MAADHYTTLGISRDAGQDEIKRAYRRLARQHHPDANREDPDAEERFKEVTRAYEVLSDPEKRQRYDLYGDERAGASGFGGFGGISDIFDAFFGGVATASSRTRRDAAPTSSPRSSSRSRRRPRASRETSRSRPWASARGAAGAEPPPAPVPSAAPSAGAWASCAPSAARCSATS